ncbi:FkbM family methyltransferase [Pseudomonas oryzihabitans]|uniref:FkbM family methyltransferase n=1 Tax=Pseudomonas oryzihabitans TaxID=47885 RepID=UPI0028951990|nr:FkbM family methyltransferase [Pseudomonas oryzihabitans]MDT3719867.1 FkbM family methyltransferase [Pseudomonas oryzihabitans]
MSKVWTLRLVLDEATAGARLSAWNEALNAWRLAGHRLDYRLSAAARAHLSGQQRQQLEAAAALPVVETSRLMVLADHLDADLPPGALGFNAALQQPAGRWAPAWRMGPPSCTIPGVLEWLEECRAYQDTHRWSAAQRAERLLAEAHAAGGIGLYGRGMVGRAARACAERHGLTTSFWVDSQAPGTDAYQDGLPVYTPPTAPQAPVVLAAGAAQVLGELWLAARGSTAYGLSTLHWATGETREPEHQWQADALLRPGHYLALGGRLDGVESLRVLTGLLRFRRTLEDTALWQVRSTQQQWFDPDYLETATRLLIDCGGFDGDTALAYLAAVPDGRVIAIEPDPRLAARARVNLRGCSAEVIQAAVGAHTGSARFVTVEGMSGALARPDEAGIEVPLVAIDEVVQALPDGQVMLKLDVEGNEAAALAGAQRTLAAGALGAIAAYHRAGDLVDVPAVLGLLGDSAIGLRHYTGLAYETVAYTARAKALADQAGG